MGMTKDELRLYVTGFFYTKYESFAKKNGLIQTETWRFIIDTAVEAFEKVLEKEREECKRYHKELRHENKD